ncbi:unnamed protein product, partial [Adineta steineri]
TWLFAPKKWSLVPKKWSFVPKKWSLVPQMAYEFCHRYSDINYTCPIESGIGHCINTANDTSISFGWNTKTAKQMIIEVTSHIDNRWQHSRSTYKSPSSELYQIWFKIKRVKGSIALFHALDEIKIFEGSCDLTSVTSVLEVTSITIDSSQIYSTSYDSATAQSLETNEDSSMSTETLALTTDIENSISISEATLLITTTSTITSTVNNYQSTVITQTNKQATVSNTLQDITLHSYTFVILLKKS